MERGAREQVVQNLCDDLLQIGALLDEGKHVPIFHPDDAAQMCIEFGHMLFNGVHMPCTILFEMSAHLIKETFQSLLYGQFIRDAHLQFACKRKDLLVPAQIQKTCSAKRQRLLLQWRAVCRDLVERHADMALNEGGALFQIDGIRQLEETREKSIP